MAAWPGLSLNCAACWGWHEGRIDGAGAALLVRDAEPMATDVEGQIMTHHNDEAPSGQGKGLQDTEQKEHAKFTAPARFTGTDNPRQLRAIAALLRRPMPRESLDHEAGCSNAPELMAELRRRGLDAPCERISFIDRDGKPCRPGVYSLTISDRRKIYAWLAKRGGAAHV